MGLVYSSFFIILPADFKKKYGAAQKRRVQKTS
jgi:hypothetical protein